MRRLIRPLLLAAVLVLAPGEPARCDDLVPMGNEEVVRMVFEGRAHDEILAAIRTRPPAYDLSEDMLDELKLAGVPADVLAAMKARADQAAPKPPPAQRPRKGTVRLVVAFDAGGTHTLRAPSFADEDLKARLQLPKELAAREIHDLAVFLLCTTAEHVPDLWRQKSPLGRDMSLTVRHEMLAFVPGGTPTGKKPKLALPETIEADVDDLEPHDLVVGVAALIGDHWIQVAAGTMKKVKMSDVKKPISARVSAKPGPLTYEVTLTAPPR